MRPRRIRTQEHNNVTDGPAPVNSQPADRADEKAATPKETFWEQLRSLGDRWQTEDYSFYCYRLWPVTDTRNPERFLCKLAEPIDEDFLLKNYGTGKYLLMLN